MSQTATVDPRSEAVAASRHRSGSIKDLNPDPQLLPNNNVPEVGSSNMEVEGSVGVASQFINLRGKFEDSNNSGGGNATPRGGGAFGSNVSKMKERFQQGRVPGGREDHQPPPGLAHPASTGRSVSSNVGGERSPETKRKRVSASAGPGEGHALAPALDPRRRTSSTDTAPGGPGYTQHHHQQQQQQHYHHPVLTPPMSPPIRSPTSTTGPAFAPPPIHAGGQSHTSEHSEPSNRTRASSKSSSTHHEGGGGSVAEPTTHVQRFNYTRALFARMEEESRKQQEKEKVQRRLLSPSRNSSNTSSPLLSPTATSPVQESRRFPVAKDQTAPSKRSQSSSVTASFSTGVSSVPSAASASSTPSSSSAATASSSKGPRESRPRRPLSDSFVSNDAPALPQQKQKQQQLQQQSQSVDTGPNSSSSSTAAEEDVDVSQLLRARRVARGHVKRDDSIGDRSGKVYPGDNSTDPFNALQEGFDSITNGENHRAEDHNTDSSLGDRGNVDEADMPGSPPPYLPHSSRLEHSSRPSATSRLRSSGLSSSSPSSSVHSETSQSIRQISGSALPSSSSSSPAPSSTSRTGDVTRRQRRSLSPGTTAEEESKKRLSKEEIQAALEKADSYLATLGSPDDTKSPPSTTTTTTDSRRERENRRSQSQSESAAARRKFLYGDDPTSTSHPSEPVSEDITVSECTSNVSSAPPSVDVSQTSIHPHQHAGFAPSEESSEAASGTRDIPPPSYHESTTIDPLQHHQRQPEPPPYHEATATILLSSSSFQQQQQQTSDTSSSPAAPAQTSRTGGAGPGPVPIPRRAAPPPPAVPAHKPSPPPPAPEPGTAEYEMMRARGSRKAVHLDHSYADDLILPEEQMNAHESDSVENGSSSAEFLIARESGDGKEDTREGSVSSDGEPLEIDYDNLSFLEIPPIASAEEDDSSGDEVDYHKASRVSFSKKPIKVYATFSTEDYDRRNEDVDPVAASAEYELEKRVEKMDVFPVELQKGTDGLGLSIIGMGVGADAGLEKLGIFIKTLTPKGAALKSNKIQVNDQIIEVDGKSLVGVTQAYAAAVLRNTSGHVKFMIGREKDPSKSEVARLIQQSLEQDRRREEMREKEKQRMKQLEDSFQPKDEILEHHAHQHQMEDLYKQHGQHQQEGLSQEEDLLMQDDTSHSSSLGEEDKDREDLSSPLEEEIAFPLEQGEEDSSPQSNGEEVLEEVSPEMISEGRDLSGETTQAQGRSANDAASSDAEHEKLFVKFKEAQYKLAVAEAEIAKLKAKNLVLDTSEVQKKALEKKVEELNRKSLERDKHFEAMKRELSQYKDMMVASQSQHIELERKVKELGALEKKYHKAKKLIKDYQQREKDFIQERESLLEQQTEKDQQYNSLVKSLKDRIFTLEKDLTTVQKAAGLPEALPASDEMEVSLIASTPTPLVKATLNGLDEPPLSPLNQSTEDVLESSMSSEISDAPASPISDREKAIVPESVSQVSSVQTPAPATSTTTTPAISESTGSPVVQHSNREEVTEEKMSKLEFDSVNASPLLDSSVCRDKANLASAGGNANRRPPTKKTKAMELASEDQDSGSARSEVTENGSIHSGSGGVQGEQLEEETGLDMWNKHDSEADDSTVRKSELKKRKQPQAVQPHTKQQQQQKFLPQQSSKLPPHAHPAPSPSIQPSTAVSSISAHRPPPVAPKPRGVKATVGSGVVDSVLRDDASDTSSSVSQTSYDPNRPMFKSGGSEIPDMAADDDGTCGEDSGITLVSAKATPAAKGFSFPKFNWKPSSSSSKKSDSEDGGIVLLTSRPLASTPSTSEPTLMSSGGGITLISKKRLDTGYPDADVSSVSSDITPSSMMVSEPEESGLARFTLNISGTPAAQDNPAPNKRGQNQYQTCPIWDWNLDNVCHWLMALEMDKYTEAFRERNITGSLLLALDGSKLKSMGINNSKDRELLKKKIKEMKITVEKEKKLMERERKQREKEHKKQSKKK